MRYEKNGYTWNENESLSDIINPGRIQQIKEEYLKRTHNNANAFKSDKLVDIIAGDTGLSCVNCFI